MTVLGIIQARMNSSRLPGKALADLGGISVLALMVHRLRASKSISRIIVATTNSPSDDPIVSECHKLGVDTFRGEEFDVLGRFCDASDANPGFDTIVRLTGDCPFIDAGVVDTLVEKFYDTGAKYCSNRLPPPHTRTYPVGLDVEVFSKSSLKEAGAKAQAKHEREHVTPYMYSSTKWSGVRIANLAEDLSSIRLTVDSIEDLELCRNFYALLPSKDANLSQLVSTWRRGLFPPTLQKQKLFTEVDRRWLIL